MLSLAKAFLFTPGMYVIHEENKGMLIYQWIDVSEYEAFGEGSRRAVSPLFCLTQLDKNRLVSSYTNAFFSEPVFLTWADNKIKCGWAPAILYLFMRCVLISVYLILDFDVGEIRREIEHAQTANTNNTNITDIDEEICTDFSVINLPRFTSTLLSCVLMIITLFSIAIDVYEYITSYRYCRARLRKTMINKPKKRFLQYNFYRIAHNAVVIAICLQALSSLYGINPRSDFISYNRIITRTFLWWSVLYFIQLVPGADYFVISIQSMMGILGQFCLIYIVFLIVYAQLFTVAINATLRQGCAAQFNDIFTAGYNTFLAMINMLDFTQFDVTNPFPLYLTHIIYVMFSAILLLNFLVAIMSDRITEISKYKHVIVPMQKLSVVLAMERQLEFFGRWYYKWIQKRVYAEYNGRLCIIRTVCNRDTDGENALALGGFWLQPAVR